MKPTTRILPVFWMQALMTLVFVFCSSQVRASGPANDIDGDGIPNIVDPDIDNDGIPNALDKNIDGGYATYGPFAGQWVGDHIDNDNPTENDIDDDGLADDSLAEMDIDGDGKLDNSATEDDIDGDGRKDYDLSSPDRDIDGDGKLNDESGEDDIDGDGLDNDDTMDIDIDGDGIGDDVDDDIDGDGRSNSDSAETDIDGDGLSNDDPAETDRDGDGVVNHLDSDDDNDGIHDLDDADHQDESDEVEVDTSFTPTASAPPGSSATMSLKLMGSGEGRFSIDAADLVAGVYDIVVAGIVRGTITLDQKGSHTDGRTVFRNPVTGGSVLLNFTIAEQAVSLVKTGVTYFTGIAHAAPPSTSDDGIGFGHVTLTRDPATPTNAQAVAEVEYTASGAHQLQVEVEKLPVGDYVVNVGEAARGTMSVIAGSTSTYGVIVFRVNHDTGELELNFPVASQSISITQGSSVFFTGQLPAAPTP